MSLYLETAKKAADKYMQYGVEPITKLFFTNIAVTGAPWEDLENFAEEERLCPSLIKLTELTGDSKYRQAGMGHVNGILNYACHPYTGLPPGGYEGYHPIAQTRGAVFSCSENSVLIEPLWELATDKTKLIKMLDGFYQYYAMRKWAWSCIIDITNGNPGWGGPADLSFPSVMSIMAEATHLTGNQKYMQICEDWYNHFKSVKEVWFGQGDTGMFYSAMDNQGRRVFVKDYAWGIARSFAKGLKYTNSPLYVQVAKKHMDALIQYAWNKNGKFGWAHPIDADTGQLLSDVPFDYPLSYKLPPAFEMYMDECLFELYKKTGNSEYLAIAEQNIPTTTGTYDFPTHHVPEIIIRNIDLYKITGNIERLNAAKAMADQLVNWIIAQDYWIWGGLEEAPKLYVGVDNFWHSVLALLQLAEVLSVPRHILTITSSPIPVTVEINPL